MEFIEVELKYDADAIKLRDFKKLINDSFSNIRWQEVASWDDYFVDKSQDFMRYRHNEHQNQMTLKKKMSDVNNNKRIEVNLDLEKNSFSTVSKFAELQGYKHNFKIFKWCDIAWLEKVNIVYYIVQDDELHEKRRFIEIEANESYNWKSEEEAMEEVVKIEKLLEPLGISPQNRLRKSLFEMYQK
jgi:adenylate cyclase class IV